MFICVADPFVVVRVCIWGGAHHYLMLRDLVMRGYELESRLVVAEVHQPALH